MKQNIIVKYYGSLMLLVPYHDSMQSNKCLRGFELFFMSTTFILPCSFLVVVHEKENKQPPLDMLSSNRISPVSTENN